MNVAALLATVDLNIDLVAATVAAITFAAAFAVARQRIAALETRVTYLEAQDRIHSERTAVVETKLSNIEDLLRRIAASMNVT